MPYCFTGITKVTPNDNPNEGREIWNENFYNISCAISSLALSSNTGSTIVVSGDDNIDVQLSGVSTPPIYAVYLNDDIVLNSISSSTISADTYYIGSEPLTSVTSGLTFTNLNPTPTTIGGISAGSTFNSQTMEEMWNSLLYPYQAPAFTSFSRTNLLSTYEVGQTIDIGSQTFSWTTSNPSNVSANTISIVQNITPITTLYGPSANLGSTAITLSASYSSATPTTTTLYTISGVNTNGNTFNSIISRNWRFRVYYGTSSLTILTEPDIISLSNNPLSNSFSGTYSFAAGDYKYFCYPSSFGTATTFKDSLTNLDVPMETPYLVSVTNIYGVTTNYRVHRTTNILGGSINIIIS